MSDEEGGELPPDDESADVADAKRVRKRKITAKIREREDGRFITRVLKDEAGRRFLWMILAEAHAFNERFACGPTGFPQPEATWFEAGQQALGLRLYHTWLRLDPASIVLMHAENDPRFAKTTRKQ